MSNVCEDIKCIQFADDTTLYVSGDNLQNICRIMTDTLKNIDRWLIGNRLSLNIAKTNYMILSQREILGEEIDIRIRNTKLIRVNSINFLGVILDDKLKFVEHVDGVCKKLSRAMGVLFKMSPIVPLHTLKSLYYAIFYPHLIFMQ